MDVQMDPPLKYTSEQRENQADDKKSSCNEIFNISNIQRNNSFDDFKILIYDFIFFFSIFI